MADFGFKPTTVEAPSFSTIDKPFWKLTVNARDLSNVQYYDFSTWNVSGSADTHYWTSPWNSGSLYAGAMKLVGPTSGATADITKTINLPDDGYYLIMIRMLSRTTDSGTFTLYVDGNPVWKTITPRLVNDARYDHTRTVTYPISYYNGGDHTFKIHMVNPSGTNGVWISEIIIYPITKYVACSDKSHIERNAVNLDVLSIDFTENSVTENNTLTIDVTSEDKLFNSFNESALFTDLGDPITMELGHNYRNAVPKFGGYVIAPSVTENKIEIKAMDRMLDLIMQPCFMNTCIGTKPDTTYTQFSSVYDLAGYLTNTLEYELSFSSALTRFGLSMDYKDKTTCNRTSSIAGYMGSYQDYNGLKISPSSITSAGEFVLWQSSNPVDVAIYKNFGMDYNIGTSVSSLPVNFSIYMHKAGQTQDNAVKYNVVFTGTTTPSNKIGTVTPNTNNKWNWFSIDLKNLFDTYLGSGSSSQYNVTKITVSGNIDSTQVNNSNNYSLCFGWMELSQVIADAPQFSDSESKNHFDSLKKLCDETNYVSYIKPGLDRTDDILYIAPNGLSDSPVTLDENDNVLDVTNWTYDPINDGLCNSRLGSYTITGQSTLSYAYAEDIESIKKYRRIKSFDELSDVQSLTDANNSVTRYISDNKIKRLGTELTVQGNVLFHPSDYILTEINSKGLSGNYQIMGIEQKLDIEEGKYETILGINRLPGMFRQRQRALMQFYRNNRKVTY